MDEFTKDSGYQNLILVYLAFAYVGYVLKGYTAAGLKKVHTKICSNVGKEIGKEPKCTSRCSEQFGRNVQNWCKSCRSWQSYLVEYMRFKTVAWERMESWKWPTSYINIAEVFVPNICSMHTINLQDLYIESYIWTNCKEFSIHQSTLKNLREARNAVVHNSTTCVTDIQKDNCLNAMKTLMRVPDVNAYVNVVECELFFFSLQNSDDAIVLQQKNRILSKLGGRWVRQNKQDETKINDKVSRNVSYFFRGQNIYEEFQIHQNMIKSLATTFIRSFWLTLLLNPFYVLCLFLLALITVLFPLFARIEESWRLTLFGIMILLVNLLALVEPYIQKVLQQYVQKVCIPYIIRYSQHLIHRQLQHTDAQSSQYRKSTGNIKNSVTGKGEWDRCLEREDIALLTDLINRNYLPDKEQLKRTCKVFSRTSVVIGIITDKICETIKRKNDKKVKCVWAAYEPQNENHIVFVIVTKESNTDVDFKPEYDVNYRKDGDFSSESKEIILEESEQGLFPEEREIIKIQECIKKYTSKLMEKHSNLTIISASLLKCKGYGTNNCTKKRKACIVLHVHIKGLIPLRESAFPKSLDGVDVDVREGCFQIHSGIGPHEKHENVKSGCGIKAKEQDDCGTLGGFLEHPEYGLCALTCAHIFIGNKKITENVRHQYNKEVVECIQPCFELDNIDGSRFGELKLIVIRKGSFSGDMCDSVGLDYAVIAIDKNREPSDGSFPFAEPEMLKAAGFKDQSCIFFETGEIVFDYKELPRSRSNVVKYGSTTFLTCGALGWQTVSFKDKTTGLVLMNQMQINVLNVRKNEPFSAGGDSGALVFTVDDENNLTALGLLVGGNIEIGYSAATPIYDILSDINIKKLKQFPSLHESENGAMHQFSSPDESPWLQNVSTYLFWKLTGPVVCICVALIYYFLF